MTVYKRRKTGENYVNERLLLALAEHLKSPLLQIARRAELDQLNDIEVTADNALQLIDNFLLSARMASEQIARQLEPVSLSAVLNDVAHQLSKFATDYQCELQLHMAGKYEPIMAHRIGLEAALVSLGQVFIEAQNGVEVSSDQKSDQAAGQKSNQKPIVKVAAHRGKTGIVAGLFSSAELGSDMLRRAHQLYGYHRQPFPQLTAADGAGIFVAESIIDSMSAHLRVAHHQKMAGLAATFMSSKQLSLV